MSEWVPSEENLEACCVSTVWNASRSPIRTAMAGGRAEKEDGTTVMSVGETRPPTSRSPSGQTRRLTLNQLKVRAKRLSEDRSSKDGPLGDIPHQQLDDDKVLVHGLHEPGGDGL